MPKPSLYKATDRLSVKEVMEKYNLIPDEYDRVFRGIDPISVPQLHEDADLFLAMNRKTIGSSLRASLYLLLDDTCTSACPHYVKG